MILLLFILILNSGSIYNGSQSCILFLSLCNVICILFNVTLFLANNTSHFGGYDGSDATCRLSSFYHIFLVVERQPHSDPHLDDRRCYSIEHLADRRQEFGGY